MFTALRPSDRSPTRIALACMPAIVAAMPALAAPRGVTHTWDGSVNTSWQVAGNCNTNLVTAAGDSAHILGGPSNVFLNGDSANLASLFVSGGRSLTNNGYNLDVTTALATTTVTGVDSTLFITPNGGSYGFETGTLSVQSNGRLQMSGGVAMINQQLTLSSGGRILGNGHVYVHENAPAAFNAANGSDITVSGGDLLLAVISGGSIALAPTINVTNPNLTLYVDAPIFLPVNDINLGNNSAFNSEFNWILDGTLSANPGSGNTSRVEGDGSMTVNDHISVGNNGRLRVSPQVNFESTSTTSIGLGGTLELDGGYSVDAGHITTMTANSRLQLDGTPSIFGWDGDIVSNGGIIESNNALGVRIDGDLTLGSFGGLRTAINGTSAVLVGGSAVAPGLGGMVNGAFYIQPTATLSLNMAGTSLIVNGDLYLRTDSTSSGDGTIQVNAGGSMFVQQDANVSVDVDNGGDLEVGDNTQRRGIDINAPFSQTATGVIHIDVGPSAGFGETGADKISVWDDAVLAGSINVRLAPGFTPVVGAEYIILSANNISGTFASVTGAPGFSLSYTSDEVTLNYNGVAMPGDVNVDGVVDVNDLLAVITSWGPCPPPPATCPADLDENGFVDVNDLLEVIVNWS